jgi:Holliday junction resolvasome RuvABC endonuclease subunit
MLKLPVSSQTYATIVGMDPGTETLGFSELDFDLATFEITRWEPQTYYGSKLLKSSDWIGQVHGDRIRRLHAHRKNLIKLFDQIEPYVIGCEAPFINMKRPQAYGALTEAVYEIRLAVIAHSAWKELYVIDPSSVKNSVGAKGNADKNTIKACILAIPELVSVCTRPIIELDEHELDSGAVAYALFKNLKAMAFNKPV